MTKHDLSSFTVDVGLAVVSQHIQVINSSSLLLSYNAVNSARAGGEKGALEKIIIGK